MFFIPRSTQHTLKMPDIDLYIIGATTRATADMARRAGLKVGCFDSYADNDLKSTATWVRQTEFIDQTPEISPEAFQQIVQQRPWIATGPLENCPKWVEIAAQKTTYLGNKPSTCRALRDIFELSASLSEIGFSIQFPEIQPLSVLPNPPEQWLFKPHSGTGGWEIQAARKRFSSRLRPQAKTASGYWQKRIAGPSFGATILSDQSQAIVAGICRSFHGIPGRPFAYRGSTGPVDSGPIRKMLPELTSLANWLTREFQIRGLWNIDLIQDRRNRKWFVLEVNPRPSASMEVLELAAGQPLMAIHMQIFRNDPGWTDSALKFAKASAKASSAVVKRVLYSERSRKISLQELPAMEQDLWSPQRWADIPCPGSRVYRGYPLMTQIGLEPRKHSPASDSKTNKMTPGFVVVYNECVSGDRCDSPS